MIGTDFQQLGTTTEVNQSLAALGNPVLPAGACAADARRLTVGLRSHRRASGAAGRVEFARAGRAARVNSAGGAASTRSGPGGAPAQAGDHAGPPRRRSARRPRGPRR